MKTLRQVSPKQQSRSNESWNRRSKATQLKLQRMDQHEDQVKKSLKIVEESPSKRSSASEILMNATNGNDSSPESEVLDCSPSPFTDLESSEKFELSADPSLSDPTETFDHYCFSPSSKIGDDDLEETHDEGQYSEISKSLNIDAQFVVQFLTEARIQLSEASDVDQRTKNLLNALIEIVIENFYTLPDEEQDRFSKRSSRSLNAKVRFGFLIFWLFIVSVFMFFNSDARRSPFHALPPT